MVVEPLLAALQAVTGLPRSSFASGATRSASSRAKSSSLRRSAPDSSRAATRRAVLSANRFRRRREEQERDLIEAAAAETARILGPWRDKVEHVALGGDRTAVGRTLAERPDLDWLPPLALERFFDVPDPRLRVLEELTVTSSTPAKVVEGG